MAGTAVASLNGSGSIEAFVRDQGNFSISGIQLRNRAAVERLYAARDYAPLWTTQSSPTYTSVVVSQRLANANMLGLQPSKYYGKLLNQLATNNTHDNPLQYEILLSDSIISYFDDLAHGSTLPPTAKAGWRLEKAQLNVEAITDGFFNGVKSLSETIDDLQPRHQRFAGLLQSLQQYQTLADNGGWLPVSRGPSIELGDNGDRVAQLRRRLLSSGDLQYNTATDQGYFDTELTEALIRFQRRHGLEADGVVGPKTLKALNVPIEERLAQLQLNLDRWRWLQRDLGHSNITVNTAGYEMDVTLGGSVAMNMNVIVGKPKHATPLFSDSMEHLVFNPSWYVPSSIAKKLLKKEAERPGYLQGSNFEVRAKSSNTPVPFNELTPFDKDPEFFSAKYWLRQLPGKENALGGLKFMFPNQYSIYLHDTNSPELFAESERAFSHGCVRLEQPGELARLLLSADGRTQSEIDTYEILNSTKKVNLRTPLPVHLTYQTAWVDDAGVTQFRDDIYDHDKHARAQLSDNQTTYASAEASAIALTGITLVSNLY